METETIQEYQCHICKKVFENHDYLNIDNNEERDWICKDCQNERYISKYEIINGIHNSEDTALIVEDYPWGFRLRTKQRHWIETTKHGDRFVTQTLNPKTSQWCSPKKSTYSDVMVFVKEKETGYIRYRSWGVSYTSEESLRHFLEFTKDYPFNESQKEKIRQGKVIYKVREHIISETNNEDEDEFSKVIREKEQETVKKDIAKLHYYYDKQITE